MRQEEGGSMNKRPSLKQLSEITQRQIFNALQVHSQPSEGSPSRMQFHLRKFSKPVLPLDASSPRDASPKKLPPILRYLSQKFVKQAEVKKQQQQYLYKGEKKFKIHTHSLRKLEPLRKEILLPSPFKSMQRVSRSRFQGQSSQQMLVRKLQVNKITNNNKDKHRQHVRSGSEGLPFEKTLWRGEKISGWHTQQYDDV